jgi:hypothetical protein
MSVREHRRRNGSFPGLRIPFVALVAFRPMGPVLKKVPVAGPNAVDVLFVWWRLQPEGRQRGDYLCVEFEFFKVQDPALEKRARIHRVEELIIPLKVANGGNWGRPMKAAYGRIAREIDTPPLAILPREDIGGDPDLIDDAPERFQDPGVEVVAKAAWQATPTAKDASATPATIPIPNESWIRSTANYHERHVGDDELPGKAFSRCYSRLRRGFASRGRA